MILVRKWKRGDEWCWFGLNRRESIHIPGVWALVDEVLNTYDLRAWPLFRLISVWSVILVRSYISQGSLRGVHLSKDHDH